MDPYRVDVLHVADSNDISFSIPHDLIFYFLPTGNAFFYEHLGYPAVSETLCAYVPQFIFIIGNSTAGTSHCKGRTNNYRITYLPGKIQGTLYCFHNLACYHRLADAYHGILEFLPVLSHFYCLYCSPQQFYIVLFQETCLCHLHCQIESRLSSESRQNAVRSFNENDLFKHFKCQWFNIYLVCNICVSHDGCRIAVQKN